jgi:hypothetical protein
MAVWRGFHPEWSVGRWRLTKVDFSFAATRAVGAGVDVTCFVRGWKADDTNCALRVRMALRDERVGALESIALERDVTDLDMFDFDVLAASSVMDEEEMPDSPLMDSQGTKEEFACLVEDYSRRIDRIWKFVGGVSVQGLERLAIWAIRNRKRAGTVDLGISLICAAFVYGERELSQEVMAEFRTRWERRVQLEPRQAVFDVYDNVRRDLVRLENAMRAQTMH